MDESYNEKYDVFISYSRKDYVDENNNVIPGNVVSKVKDALEKINVKYWFDENGVYSGDEFAPLIARAIKNSEIFLFISSHHSNASDWTSNEIATAHAYKKRIIPLLVDDSVFNESVILYIAKLDHIDFMKNPEKAINRMTDSIKSYLNNVEEQKKREEEKRKLEAERLKKAEEKERELSHIRKRLTDVSKELDSLRSQWQVSSTLYDELKAKEAALLGIAYHQNVLTLPELKAQTSISDEGKNDIKPTNNPFKRLARWFTNPNGKERSPWISAIVRIIIILGYILTGLLLITFFDEVDKYYSRNFLLPISLVLLVYCYSLYQALKWKRLPIYILLFGLIGIVIWLISQDITDPRFTITLFCIFVLPFILATSLLLTSRYHGKTFFEQTEPVRDNLHDKQFLTSLALECVLLLTVCIPLFILIRAGANGYYSIETIDTTEVVEEAPADSTAVAAEELYSIPDSVHVPDSIYPPVPEK